MEVKMMTKEIGSGEGGGPAGKHAAPAATDPSVRAALAAETCSLI